MEFLFSNWMLIVASLAIVSVVGYIIYVFMKRPTTEQISKVKEWLLYAVTMAERELGSGTGQIKLRYVYDMFIASFPYLVKVIPFETFSLLVDEALDKFREILGSNINLQDYVDRYK